MNKPQNWDTTEAQTGGFEQLPPGAYICVVKDAHEITSSTGKNMLQLWLDIADGEFKDYFQKQFISTGQKYGEAKWRGTYNQLTEGDSLGYFKGLIQDIQDSNPGYIFNFDEKTLVNKRIGGVFGREQYKNQNGDLKFAIKCFYCCDIAKVKEIQPPKDKLLSASVTATGANGYIYSTSAMEELNVDDTLPF